MSKSQNLRVDLREFKPSEVELITGLTTMMQRDWRYRDFLRERPAATRHSRFDILEVAEMLVMKQFSDRGVGPSLTKELAADCALHVVGHCIHINGHESVAGWKEVGPLLGFDIDLDTVEGGIGFANLVTARAAKRDDVDLPFRFFAWGANDRQWFFDDADKIFESMGGWTFENQDGAQSDRRFGVLMIIDLLDAADALWAGLVRTGRRDFVTVEVAA